MVCGFDADADPGTQLAHRNPGGKALFRESSGPEMRRPAGLRQPGDLQAGGLIGLKAPGKAAILGGYGSGFHL